MSTSISAFAFRRLRSLAVSAMLCLPLAGQAATFTIVNLDGPNEGFNDISAFSPVGGNNAVTLGLARLNALQHALNILGGLLASNVTIKVEVNMNPMGGGLSSATLGSAGPNAAYANFSGAPVANTWYVEALANKLAGTDLGSGTNDIGAEFNSDVDNGTVLGATNWYYGLDGNAGSHIDFVTVALHELVHGLGFLTLVNLSTGAKALNLNDAYMRHLEHHGASPADYPSMSDAQRVTASTSDPNLHWTGPSVTAASGGLSGGVSNGHVRMHGPNPQQPGSSVSHFSSALSPNEIMEPSYFGPNHSIGLAAQLLADIGWSGGAPPPPPPPSNSPPHTPSNPNPGDTASGVSITPSLSWTGGDPDAGNTVTYDVFFGTSASPPQVTSNQASNGYTPGTLANSTTYFWKIVARDNLSATTTGPVWSFTTAAAAPPPPPPPSSMPLPTGPTAFGCVDGSIGVFSSIDPSASRPLGAVNVGGELLLQLGSVAYAAAVDVYVVAQLPDGALFIMNNLKQWVPFPVNIVPYRAGSSAAFITETVLQVPLAVIPPGTYSFYFLVVTSGTNPETFNQSSSSYFLWCMNRTFP